MFDWIPTLETKRLVLRERNEEIILRILKDYNEATQLEFFNFKSIEELNTERSKAAKGYTSWQMSFKVWDMIEKSSQKNIGSCGFHTWNLRHDRAEIGYAITDENAKRKGYMSEAVERIIQYGFADMNLHRIEAYIHPTNTASLRLIEKNGFSYEGLKKQDYKKDGKHEDSAVFGLLSVDSYQ